MLLGPSLAIPAIRTVTLRPEAAAVIDSMTTTPGALRRQDINALVVGVLPYWSRLGVFYIFAAHADGGNPLTSQASLRNWKNPSGTPALATNSPTFIADRGYTGDGVSAFIDTQTAWNAVPGVAQNSAHLGWYGKATTAGATLAGLSGSTNVSLQRSASTLQTRLNNAAADTVDAYSTSAGAHLCISRFTSTGYDRYIDGVAGTASAQTSASPVAANLTALRVNATYGTSAVTVSALHAGSALTAADVLAVRNEIQAYMAAVGAS